MSPVRGCSQVGIDLRQRSAHFVPTPVGSVTFISLKLHGPQFSNLAHSTLLVISQIIPSYFDEESGLWALLRKMFR